MFAKQAQLAVVALALAAAGSAFAADAKTDRNVFDSEAALSAPAKSQPSQLTREQVRAEFLAARANGELNVFDNETTAYAKPDVQRAHQTQLAQAAK